MSLNVKKGPAFYEELKENFQLTTIRLNSYKPQTLEEGYVAEQEIALDRKNALIKEQEELFEDKKMLEEELYFLDNEIKKLINSDDMIKFNLENFQKEENKQGLILSILSEPVSNLLVGKQTNLFLECEKNCNELTTITITGPFEEFVDEPLLYIELKSNLKQELEKWRDAIYKLEFLVDKTFQKELEENLYTCFIEYKLAEAALVFYKSEMMQIAMDNSDYLETLLEDKRKKKKQK